MLHVPRPDCDATLGGTAVSDPAASAPTPMMAQYLEIKAANPDSLLFYRMGDFYELFFDDAAEASRALGITLTRRGKHEGADIPMAGVPVVSADDYLQKLIALGYRVAVCEQTEDPAEAKRRGGKSVVRRAVVRLVTPGTITEEALLEPARANHLASLCRLGGANSGEVALSWAELSTGAFRVAPSTLDQAAADIAAIDPSEIVVPDTLREDERWAPLFARLGRRVRFEPAALFDAATAEERLCRFFHVGTLDGFGRFGRCEMASAAALIGYLGRTQIDARFELKRPERMEAGSFMRIDPATRASLELMRTAAGKRPGSLLGAIDRCLTGAGSRLLASRLSWPLTDPAAINRRLDAVGVLVEEGTERRRLRDTLRGLPDVERSLGRLALDRAGPRDLVAVADALDGARALAAVGRDGPERPREMRDAFAVLDALPFDLGARLRAALADPAPALKRDGHFVRPGTSTDLDEARALRDDSRRVIADLQGRYAEATGLRTLKVRHNNVLGYFVEVPEAQGAALLAEASGFRHRQTLASAMRFTTPELADLDRRINEAGARALQIELALFDAMRREVLDASEALREGAEAIGVLDVASALADLAASEEWTRPVVDDSLAFQVEGGRHPIVEAALRAGGGRPFVRNDCDLSPPGDAGAGAIWLLTGPNMGGKSTFLRQNALIAVLAQIGAFVPATSAHVGVVDRLFSRVGASDDLSEGRSTFMVEMVETAAILNQAGERTLVILDEIGRGTATYDGLSIAFAAVEHLHEVNRCRALFATHFHEMTALGARLPRLRNATVRVKEWRGEVIFLHEVGPGVADRSYGVQVARLAGLPESVVERARQVLGELERADAGTRRTAFVDDLPLFSASLRRAAPAAAPSPALDALKAVEPDALSPREALEELYRLKGLLGV